MIKTIICLFDIGFPRDLRGHHTRMYCLQSIFFGNFAATYITLLTNHFFFYYLPYLDKHLLRVVTSKHKHSFVYLSFATAHKNRNWLSPYYK